MATFTKLPSGSWRAQVRRKGRYISETCLTREDARRWATGAECDIDRGARPKKIKIAGLKTLADLIDLHIADLGSVGKAIGRTKLDMLKLLKKDPVGKVAFADLDRLAIIAFGRRRAKGGAGPVTVGMYIGTIKTVLIAVTALHDIETHPDQIDLARAALAHLGLVGKSNERNRRPTDEELQRLFDYFDTMERLTIPMTRIMQFAIATAMRQEEICRVVWDDYAPRTRMLWIRNRKDPRHKDGNDQRIPLLAKAGFDAVALVEAQRPLRTNAELRIFPYNSKSVSAAFTRACKALGIVDLHFHDLRHEGTSRLFELGLQIQQAALVSGHKDWKMLKRYTHLRPESLHDFFDRL
ncbi:integrase [Caulobacter vibrioides]|nr:integrase [Caulobacter vibrioides]